jgi:hypothetical protein
MNSKQLVILLLLVVVVGGAGLILRQRQSASWEGANPAIGKKLLGDLPVNDVAHISMKQGTNELDLVKKGDLWRVRERGDYPANYSEISDFLIKLRDLKIVQSEKVGPSQLPRLSLATGQETNSALVVDFKDQAEKPIRTLLLGKKHMKKGAARPSPYGDMGEEGWPDGRYVKVGTDSDNVSVISDALANIEPKPEQWLNKDFFKVEKVRSVAVNFPNPTNSWKLTRETETGEWKLAEAKPAEQLDSSKASGVANPLTSPAFTDVASSMKPDELDKPTVATVETFDNFTYTLKVGQKTNDNFPLAMTVTADLPKERAPGKDEKPDDKDKLDKEFKEKQKKLEEKLAQEKAFEKWVYLVSTWTVDPLLKERAQLLVEKKEEPKKDAAATGETPTIADPLKAGETAKTPGETPTPPAAPKPESK